MRHISHLATRRGIQIVLGCLWLLDACLQFQPKMFTSNFANSVIAPSAIGQPLLVSGPSHLFVRILLLHPAIFNSIFAAIQVLLAILILNKKTVKAGLIASMFWAAGVWYVGEGLGGILGVHTIILMGAPGAALIYGLLAVAVLPTSTGPEPQRPAYWLPLAWGVLWVGGAIYQLLPGQNTSSALASMISSNASGAPHWLASLDIHLSNSIATTSNWVILVLVILQLIIGIAIFFHGRIKSSAVLLGVILSLLFWVFGQSLGQYYSGLATDPNSAPMFCLLGLTILGCKPIGFKKLWIDSGRRLEQILT
jgi:hypothetical protein